MSLGNKEVFAENLQYYMDKNGLTRKQLSNITNIGYTTLSSWLQGDTYPRIDKVELLANYFKIQKSDLIEKKGSQNENNKFQQRLQETMKKRNLRQVDLAKLTGIGKSAINQYIKGVMIPKQDKIHLIAEALDVNPAWLWGFDVDEQNFITKTTSIMEQLKNDRQANVLNYANHQLTLQNNEANSINEAPARYAVQAVEALAAGTGYSYGDNEVTTYYTDRDDLPSYDYASAVVGDSMEPYYHDGDVVLIVQGYDNIQGAVYAIDYNGKSYLKKVFFEGNRIRLVSYNQAYDDIYIYLPIEADETYLNIIGRVIDSFKPIN